MDGEGDGDLVSSTRTPPLYPGTGSESEWWGRGVWSNGGGEPDDSRSILGSGLTPLCAAEEGTVVLRVIVETELDAECPLYDFDCWLCDGPSRSGGGGGGGEAMDIGGAGSGRDLRTLGDIKEDGPGDGSGRTPDGTAGIGVGNPGMGGFASV